MALFGFIGVGNMGYPLLKAAVKCFGEDEVIYYDASKLQCKKVMKETKLPYFNDNISLVGQCKFVVLVVKPQYISQVLKEINTKITNEHIIISIAAGITIKKIKDILSDNIRVVRAMPNTPAMISQGMTGLCYSNDCFSNGERDVIDKFFNSFGRYELFEESLMNAVVCANGSSPAYVYMFIEALADSVVNYGIPRDKAYILASQTVLGAAAMVLETGEHPAVLKDKVCSPGGTTIAAVKALEEHALRNALMKATEACYERAVALSKQD